MLGLGLPRAAAVSCLAILASGCASTQLNYNTLELASTVESLQTKQVLYNISKFIDDPDAIPDQIVVSSGSVATLNSVTPSLSETAAHANVVAAAPSATRTLTKVLTGATTDQWTQSWGIAPIADGDDLRRLRALYLFAALNSTAELDEYPTRKIAYQKDDKAPPTITSDPFFQDERHRVSSSNPRLCKNWIYYTGRSATTGLERPPVGPDAIPLGHYGNHDLFTTWQAKRHSCLSNFVLFVLDAAGETASPGSGGGSGGGKPKSGVTIQVVPGSQVTPDQLR
jgi:hypothetical protein